MGFLDNLFCDDNSTWIIILLIVGAVLLLSGGDGCGIGGGLFDGFNFGDNWLLIVILILVVAGDGLDIF